MNVIVVGGGKVGTYLSALLIDGGHWVKIIDEPEHEARLRRELPAEAVVPGDRTDPNMLEAAGIRHADVIVAVTDQDEVNLVVTSLARFEFGVPRTIARVNAPANAWMFTGEMGVDVALNQAQLMAQLAAEEMSLGDMITLLKLRKGRYSLVEEKVGPGAPAAGVEVANLGLPPECVLVATIRGGQLIIPNGRTTLQAGDEIIAIVHASRLEQVAAMLAARQGPGTREER